MNLLVFLVDWKWNYKEEWDRGRRSCVSVFVFIMSIYIFTTYKNLAYIF